MTAVPHLTTAWLPLLPETAAANRPLMLAPSLTAALRRCDAVFSVRPLYQGQTENAWPDEAEFLGTNNLYSREVFLCLDGTAVVWARSICQAEDGFWRQILNCGNRPLGEQLFGGTLTLERSPFSFARIPPRNIPDTETAVWARRSRFLHGGNGLVLTECFLPALSAYADKAGS